MKMRSTAIKTSRLKQFTFRAALIGSMGIPLVVVSEDIKIEIRPRTDSNVQSDIQSALEFHRKLPATYDTKGLTELAQSNHGSVSDSEKPSNDITGDSMAMVPSEPFVRPPIVIGSPSKSFQSEVRDEPGGGYVAPRVETRLPPPIISQIPGWESDRRVVSEAESRLASASRQWRPVRAQIGSSDAEASVRPQLSGSIAIGNSASSSDSTIVPANFQSTPDGFSTPALPFNPGTATPGATPNAAFPPIPQQQILPGQALPSVIPGPPVTYAVPGTTMPGAILPYNPANLPTYSSRGSTIINGEPFVTAAPCQFDAHYMVEPTFSMQNPGAGGCGQTAGPNYSGIPGNFAPPTVMPNQAPSGIYSPNNSGFRPLFGFGQDNYNVQLGRGIIGQPVAYVPGQAFRNFLRYIFP